MKKRIIAVLTILVLNLSCADMQKKDALLEKNIFNLIPNNAVALLKFSSYKKFYQNINKILDDRHFKSEVDSIRREFGIDFLDINEVEKAGFDIDSDIGFYISDIDWINGKEDLPFSLNMFIPVKDKEKALDTLKKPLMKDFAWQRKGFFHYIEPKKNEHLVILEKDNYLFLTINLNMKREDLFSSMNKEASIFDNSEFKKIYSKINLSEDIILYANTKKVFNKGFDQRYGYRFKHVSKIMRDYQSLAIEADLDSKNLLVNSVVNFVPGSSVSRLYNVKLNKSLILNIVKNPVLFMASGLNFNEYDNILKSTQSPGFGMQYEDGIKSINKSLQIDLRKDLFDNLSGSINFGIFDGMTINRFNYNTIFVLGVKNEDKMKRVLLKILNRIVDKGRLKLYKEEINGVTFNVLAYQFMKFYTGVHNKKLIFSMNKDLLQSAISGNISDGFSKNLDSKLIAKISGNYSNLYIGFGEVTKVIDNIYPPDLRSKNVVLNRIYNILNNFKYLSVNSKIEGNYIYTDFVLDTKFNKPFFQGLYEMSNENNIQ